MGRMGWCALVLGIWLGGCAEEVSVDRVMVLVAGRDLHPGVTITEEDVYGLEVPTGSLPEGVFLNPEYVIGRIPKERILSNEMVRAGRLADPESGTGLSAVIPRGMRAASVGLEDSGGLDGFLHPGNYVDVLATDGEATRTLLAAAFVLAVWPGVDPPRVTLLVTAEQAEDLASAQVAGALRLLLRNDLDVGQADLESVDINSLRRKLEKPRVSRVRRAVQPTSEGGGLVIIRGSKSADVGPIGIVRSSCSDGAARPQPVVQRTTDHRLSTFAADVDTASYTVARQALRAGHHPPPAYVRTEEFVNRPTYDYARPHRDQTFAASIESAPSPWAKGQHIVRLGLRAKDVDWTARKPVHLTLLVDTSGSMSPADRLPLAKQALLELVDALGPDDTVALTTFAGGGQQRLAPTGDHRAIEDAIHALGSGGGTAMQSGLEVAYELANRVFDPDAENRVLLLTDGGANIGIADGGQLAGLVRGYADRGITLTGLGFGSGHQDAVLETLTNQGDGTYYFIDDLAEARRVLVDRTVGTMQTVARDVKIQVEWDPSAVTHWTQLGYDNRALADADFRNDAKDAGEVGADHQVTALYVVSLAEGVDPEASLATLRVRWMAPGRKGRASEVVFPVDRTTERPSWAEASADYRLAVAEGMMAEKLRLNHEVDRVQWTDIARWAEGARRPDHQEAEELAELARLAQQSVERRGVGR